MQKFWDKDDIRCMLRGTARPFEEARPDVSEATTDLIAKGFYAALDAIALRCNVDDWRRDHEIR